MRSRLGIVRIPHRLSRKSGKQSSGIRNLKECGRARQEGDTRSGRPSNRALPYPYGPNAHAAGSSEPSEDSPPVFLPLHPALLSRPLTAEAVTGDEVMNQPHAWQTYCSLAPRRLRCLPGRPQRHRTHFDQRPPRYRGASRLRSARISVRLATNARHLRWSSQRPTRESPLPIS